MEESRETLKDQSLSSNK